jgi:chaperonin cofactor prefoldin
MKTIYIILFFFPIIVISQKSTEVKQLDADNFYYTEYDTSANGVITITHTPTQEILKELDSKINSLAALIDVLTQQKTTIELQLASLSKQLTQIQGIRQDIVIIK